MKSPNIPTLESIGRCEFDLTNRFNDKLVINDDLDRSLVSFQANKRQGGFRWFKYKEGFSANLIAYILRRLGLESGKLLDPFAGSGAALFVASSRGLDSVGIELLPVGCEIIEARKRMLSVDAPNVCAAIRRWINEKPWTNERAYSVSTSQNY